MQLYFLLHILSIYFYGTSCVWMYEQYFHVKAKYVQGDVIIAEYFIFRKLTHNIDWLKYDYIKYQVTLQWIPTQIRHSCIHCRVTPWIGTYNDAFLNYEFTDNIVCNNEIYILIKTLMLFNFYECKTFIHMLKVLA